MGLASDATVDCGASRSEVAPRAFARSARSVSARSSSARCFSARARAARARASAVAGPITSGRAAALGIATGGAVCSATGALVLARSATDDEPVAGETPRAAAAGAASLPAAPFAAGSADAWAGAGAAVACAAGATTGSAAATGGVVAARAAGAACGMASARAFRARSFSNCSCSAFARAAARACASAVAGPTDGRGAGATAMAGASERGAGEVGAAERGSLEETVDGLASIEADAAAASPALAASGARRRRTMTVGCRRRTSARGERALLPAAAWAFGGAGRRLETARAGWGWRDSGVDERDPGVIVWATSFGCARGGAAVERGVGSRAGAREHGGASLGLNGRGRGRPALSRSATSNQAHASEPKTSCADGASSPDESSARSSARTLASRDGSHRASSSNRARRRWIARRSARRLGDHPPGDGSRPPYVSTRKAVR